VRFDATASAVATGRIVAHEWSFGDGADAVSQTEAIAGVPAQLHDLARELMPQDLAWPHAHPELGPVEVRAADPTAPNPHDHLAGPRRGIVNCLDLKGFSDLLQDCGSHGSSESGVSRHSWRWFYR
jgi:hypothetical protein